LAIHLVICANGSALNSGLRLLARTGSALPRSADTTTKRTKLFQRRSGRYISTGDGRFTGDATKIKMEACLPPALASKLSTFAAQHCALTSVVP